MAVAEASFRISILTMSAGLMVDRGDTVDVGPLSRASPKPRLEPLVLLDCTITPSITYKGSALELMVAVPRTRIDEAVPGAPEVLTAVTPAARPWSDWSREEIIEPFIAFSPRLTEEPEMSLFFIVPYPTTTTSSSSCLSSWRLITRDVWLPTLTSFVTYPI